MFNYKEFDQNLNEQACATTHPYCVSFKTLDDGVNPHIYTYIVLVPNSSELVMKKLKHSLGLAWHVNFSFSWSLTRTYSKSDTFSFSDNLMDIISPWPTIMFSYSCGLYIAWFRRLVILLMCFIRMISYFSMYGLLKNMMNSRNQTLISEMSHSFELTFHDLVGWLYIAMRQDIYEAYI